MNRLISKMLKQRAVYWAPAGVDNYGKPTVATGVEIRVRWENTAEEYISNDGTKHVSSSVVYMEEDLLRGGKLFLGVADDVADLDVPPATAQEIMQVQKTPSLSAAQYLRRVML